MTREERDPQADLDALRAEIAKHNKATKVADGLQNTRTAREDIRKGKKR